MTNRIVACLVFLSGCRVMMLPEIYSFRNFEVYSDSYDNVWSAVEDCVKKEGWTTETVDRITGVIATDWIKDDSSAGDYGNPGGMWTLVKGSKRMTVNVKILKVGASETRVRVNCLFQARWSNGKKKRTASGTSKGVVERLILEGIRTRVLSSTDEPSRSDYQAILADTSDIG